MFSVLCSHNFWAAETARKPKELEEKDLLTFLIPFFSLLWRREQSEKQDPSFCTERLFSRNKETTSIQS